MSTACWRVHVIGPMRSRVRVRSAACLQFAQLLAQLRHEPQLIIPHLLSSGVDGGPNHHVELLINGINVVLDHVIQHGSPRMVGLASEDIKALLYAVQGLCWGTGVRIREK